MSLDKWVFNTEAHPLPVADDYMISLNDDQNTNNNNQNNAKNGDNSETFRSNSNVV